MSLVNLEKARHNMVEQQVRPWDVLDPRVLDTLENTPRDAFTPDTYKGLAYADTEIPLGHDESMMHPILEGRMLQALDIQETDQILEIGTGSGYITACLAKLGAHVDSIEIDDFFSHAAADKLARQNITNATLTTGDAVANFDDTKKYDVICVCGSMTELPESYKKALNPGGRIFVITGEAPVMHAHLITRTGEDSWADQQLFETSLKPLTHAEKSEEFSF